MSISPGRGSVGEPRVPPREAFLGMDLIRFFFAAATGYLLGTLPSSDIASGLVSGGSVDLRSAGSRNPGGMNARRVFGRPAGIAVTATDIGKGFLACAGGRRLAGDTGAHVAGVAAVAGHCYPVWSRFRGGKGVATSFGQCAYTFPVWAPIDFGIAMAVASIPRLRRPALVSVCVSSAAWLSASAVWWRRGLPNLWGPRPTVALLVANGATVLVILSRGVTMLRHGEPDELSVPR